MNRFLLVVLIFAGLVTSCVPNKDLIYLQNKNADVKESVIMPVAAKPYRVQTNDVLSINIKALDAKLVEIFSTKTSGDSNTAEGLYFDGFTVDDHGNIRIPVLGEVNVIGYTLDEIRIKIEKQLLDEYFKKEANIFVSVKLGGFRYTINGEIASPGTQILFQEKVSIMEAIANAGDITVTGNRKDVTIIRQYPHGTEIHSIDLTDVKAMQSPYFYIQPNDYIYVKPLKQKSWGTGTTGVQTLATIFSALSLITTIVLLKNL